MLINFSFLKLIFNYTQENEIWVVHFFEKMVYIINRLIKMYKKVYGFYQK